MLSRKHFLYVRVVGTSALLRGALKYWRDSLRASVCLRGRRALAENKGRRTGIAVADVGRPAGGKIGMKIAARVSDFYIDACMLYNHIDAPAVSVTSFSAKITGSLQLQYGKLP
jgi:hypothetical protein